MLVKWTVDAPDVRHFLPRLSSPIVHLTCSTDSRLVAVSTLDNGLYQNFISFIFSMRFKIDV